MIRAVQVVRAQLRASVAMALQYRLEFAVQGALALLWIAVTLFPLLVLFGNRPEVAGWTFAEMLVVLGWFVALKGVLEGTLSPSLMQVIEHVRKGTLDFVLLKPADAQLLVSLSKIEPWRLIDLLAAGGIFAIAFQRIGRPPGLTHVLLALVLLCGAILVLYSIAILVVSIAFIAVRVDNLLYLFIRVFGHAAVGRDERVDGDVLNPVFLDGPDYLGDGLLSLDEVFLLDSDHQRFVEPRGRENVLSDGHEVDPMILEDAADTPIQLVEAVLVVVDPDLSLAVNHFAGQTLTRSDREGRQDR